MILDINQITIDEKLNPRVDGLDIVKVAEYAEDMSAGDKFPPIDVFSDRETYWVVDGRHRIEASKHAGMSEIEATIHQGSWRDAKLFTFGVNAEHGKRKTNADKRKAITEMLMDEEWSKWSDREIARKCRVHHQLVGTLREKHTGDSSSMNSERTFIHHKTGQPTTMQTANIGGKADAEPTGQIEYPVQEELIVIPPSPTVEPMPPPSVEDEADDDELDEIEAEPAEPAKEKSKRFTIPPRTEEQKEQDRIHNERSVSRMVRLAGIVKYVERIPTELITRIYRDLARWYHPDSQHGEKLEIVKQRTEAFAFIADIKYILEASDVEFEKFARIKGIIETQS